MDYPTPETVDQWDDASVFAAAGFHAVSRYDELGFEALSEIERVLCCLFLFDNEANNGGFGQWLWGVCPRALAGTPAALQTVGAAEMARFVQSVLGQFDDMSSFQSLEDWQPHFESLPDDLHRDLEMLSVRFLELETRFLDSAYAYAREHWQEVRTA